MKCCESNNVEVFESTQMRLAFRQKVFILSLNQMIVLYESTQATK